MSVSLCPTQQQRGGELVLGLIAAGVDQGRRETIPHRQTLALCKTFLQYYQPSKCHQFLTSLHANLFFSTMCLVCLNDVQDAREQYSRVSCLPPCLSVRPSQGMSALHGKVAKPMLD